MQIVMDWLSDKTIYIKDVHYVFPHGTKLIREMLRNVLHP